MFTGPGFVSVPKAKSTHSMNAIHSHEMKQLFRTKTKNTSVVTLSVCTLSSIAPRHAYAVDPERCLLLPPIPSRDGLSERSPIEVGESWSSSVWISSTSASVDHRFRSNFDNMRELVDLSKTQNQCSCTCI